MRLGAIAALMVAIAVPASGWAHHSIAALYDREKAVRMDGKIVRVELVNPHSKVEVEFRRPDGQVVRWALETSSPGGLARMGLDKETLIVGDPVQAVGYPARSGAREAWLTRLATSKRTYDLGLRRNSAMPIATPAG
jgi:hypothetical protein